jgi:cytochrome c biogenesis protein CcmG/thiol:disulfide interchange protein DsbE
LTLINRRSFLIIPPAAAAAAFIGVSQDAGIEALDVKPLEGALHASGAPVKGFRYAQLRGWVTVVHAFASWRPECADECVILRDYMRNERFQLAGLIVRDNEQDARAFIERHGNPYDALAFDRDGSAERSLAVQDVPTTFILGADARVIHTLRAPLTRDYIEQTMMPIIEEASPMTPLLASRDVRLA